MVSEIPISGCRLSLNVQFFAFSLLVLYYARVTHKQTWKDVYQYRFYTGWGVVNVALLVGNIGMPDAFF
jgi:hypothetical protein